MSVINGLFLSAADRAVLSDQYEFQGCPEAIKHLIMHIDRIKSSANPQAQIGICIGAMWVYSRLDLISVSDFKWLDLQLEAQL